MAREYAREGRDALAGKATARVEDATRDEEWREEIVRVMQEDWGRLQRRREGKLCVRDKRREERARVTREEG